MNEKISHKIHFDDKKGASKHVLFQKSRISKFRKRGCKKQRKAPQAPKRFKSSYILFFLSKQQEIKSSLGKGATATDLSKIIAGIWRNLPLDQKAVWKAKSEKERLIYMKEEAAYSGPWQVPKKRMKKDPNAPKRPRSAFLFFLQATISIVRRNNPTKKHSEILGILGQMWKYASPEQRRPFIRVEAEKRKQYKIDMAKWKIEQDEIRKREYYTKEKSINKREIESSSAKTLESKLSTIEPIHWDVTHKGEDSVWYRNPDWVFETLYLLEVFQLPLAPQECDCNPFIQKQGCFNKVDASEPDFALSPIPRVSCNKFHYNGMTIIQTPITFQQVPAPKLNRINYISVSADLFAEEFEIFSPPL